VSGLTGPLLFARSRGLARCFTTLVVIGLLAGGLPRRLHQVPGGGDRAVVLPMIALGATGLLACVSFGRPDPELEGVLPRRLWPCRAVWASTVVVVAAAVMTLALDLDGREWSLVLWRNVLGSIGIGLLSTRLLPVTLNWLPLSLVLGITLMYGTTDSEGTARWWALLVQEPSEASLFVGLVLAAAGVSTYVIFDGFREETPDRA
jgi:hypothetical protein